MSVPVLGQALASRGFEPIDHMDFYRELFPAGELDDELFGAELEAVYDGTAPRTGKFVGLINYIKGDAAHAHTVRRSIYDDLDELDAAISKPWDSYDLAIFSPISYAGKTRASENARFMYAFGIELDDLIVEDGQQTGLDGLIRHWDRGVLPRPTVCVASGHGLHLYYFFKTAVPMYKTVADSMAKYKKRFTKFLWNRYITTLHNDKDIQYESLFQGFRAVGTRTKKGHGEVAWAYRTGEAIDISYLNSFNFAKGYEIEEVYKSKLTLQEAKAKYPEWYEKRVVRKEEKGRWVCNRAVYDWWLRRIRLEGTVGHRYNCLMCLAVYAIKCDISYDELEKDCFSLLEDFDAISKPGEPFTVEDVVAALQTYLDKEMVTYPINSIINRSGIPIEKNKRNGRKQSDHVKLMNYVRDEINKNTDWRKGNGRKPKQQQVQEWRAAHPDGRKADCIRETGLSKPTVLKWWDTEAAATQEKEDDIFFGLWEQLIGGH